MLEYEVAFSCSPLESFEDSVKVFHDHFDGIMSERDGLVTAVVLFDAASGLLGALETADALRSVGIHATRVDRDLVDASEIASRLGRSRQNIQQWVSSRRREDFPTPYASVGGRRLWAWGDVSAWAKEHLEIDLPANLSHHEMVRVDASLCSALALPVALSWSDVPFVTSRRQTSGQKSETRYSSSSKQVLGPASKVLAPT